MKRTYTLIMAILLLSAGLSAKTNVNVIRCDKKAATSFAVITDSRTYHECAAEFSAYKEVLEKEGLGTYIIHADWSRPEEVKEEILKISKKKPVLEGIVLAGDVPVVMVREAQHMTTAFKMNEQLYPMFESSVASDRYYDDFDLEFEFIQRDSLRNDLFYYKLLSDGSQILRPDIYSARMKVPAMMEGDKYERMRSFLKKAVAAHCQENVLDNMTFFAGHGYNSDCLTIWRQRPVVYREHFPYAFAHASQNRFLNFRQKDRMKDNLAVELQRPGCDFFQFSEHGAYDVQYLNGTSEAAGLEENYEQLKRSVASMYSRYKGTDDDEPFLKEVLDSIYKLPRSCVSDSAMAHYETLDSLEFEGANLFLKDLARIKSNPRVVMLNACYNGSFHNEKGYVAGFHVFGDGDCVAAQGNTVNVLQDKWEDKLLGYLSIGERVGMWQKEITYLESHLIGDPTFRFTPHHAEEEALCRQLHHDLVFSSRDSDVWTSCLTSASPLMRAAGITHLVETEGNHSAAALRLFQTDASWNVRLNALHALSRYMDDNTRTALKSAFSDPYEVIVRTACRIAGASGDEGFIDDLEKIIATRPELSRIAFTAESALKVIQPATYGKLVKMLADTAASDSRKISAMRSFRNNRVLEAVQPMLDICCDAGASGELRKVAAEVLGWYGLSLKRGDIVASLTAFLKESGKDCPRAVADEMTKTIKRLQWK